MEEKEDEGKEGREEGEEKRFGICRCSEGRTKPS